jgi:hypothetical protein
MSVLDIWTLTLPFIFPRLLLQARLIEVEPNASVLCPRLSHHHPSQHTHANTQDTLKTRTRTHPIHPPPHLLILKNVPAPCDHRS